MERVFRLTRRIHPTSRAKIDYDDNEKKDLILVDGGEDMHCGTSSSILGWHGAVIPLYFKKPGHFPMVVERKAQSNDDGDLSYK